jgi:predicted phage-related endonuclease
MIEAPVVDSDDRKAFLERRQKVIGATDAAPILGLGKRGSAMAVYLDKIGEPIDDEQSLPVWLGLKLQATVAELYTAQEGIKLRAANRQFIHPVYEWMGCHLDYRAWGKPKLLVEIKTRAYMRGWGDPEADDPFRGVPPEVWVQCQHEMAVVDAEECHVAVLFGHHTFRVYRIPRDQEFIQKLIVAEEEFWTQHVAKREPPTIDGSEATTAWVKRRFPADTAPPMPATPEQVKLVKRLILARQNLAQVTLAHDALENQVKDIIGLAGGMIGPGFRITWKKNKDSIKTGWEQVAYAYRNTIVAERQARGIQDEDDLDTLRGLYTETKQGSRPFLLEVTEDE